MSDTRIFKTREDFGIEVGDAVDNPEQARRNDCYMTDIVTLDLQGHIFITTLHFTAGKVKLLIIFCCVFRKPFSFNSFNSLDPSLISFPTKGPGIFF